MAHATQNTHMIRWADRISAETNLDATETAKNAFGVDIMFKEYRMIMPVDFHAKNHRARFGATVEEIYPPDNRPRGDRDIESVRYHMTTDNEISPIAVLEKDGWIMLDGVHRLVAAFILNCPIKVAVYVSISANAKKGGVNTSSAEVGVWSAVAAMVIALFFA